MASAVSTFPPRRSRSATCFFLPAARVSATRACVITARQPGNDWHRCCAEGGLEGERSARPQNKPLRRRLPRHSPGPPGSSSLPPPRLRGCDSRARVATSGNGVGFRTERGYLSSPRNPIARSRFPFHRLAPAVRTRAPPTLTSEKTAWASNSGTGVTDSGQARAGSSISAETVVRRTR